MKPPMTHAEWRKAFRDCQHKHVNISRRCSYLPNGNPYCGLYGAKRCTFNICPKKDEKR